MKAKKSLGQNFLKSGIALRKIIEAGEIANTDVVLEIGPGKGALTSKLLESAGLVIAIEKDRELFQMLSEKFALQIKSRSLVLIHGDILQFSISNFKFSKDYKIIANIPYNITGAILKKFLTEKLQPKSMVLMVQHEVATRILARDKKESLLSISVKAYGEPKLVTKVDKRYFSPSPKVNSAIIRIDGIGRNIFEENKVNEAKFWEIVKLGFSHKRKKLSGNLKNVLAFRQLEKNEGMRELSSKRAEDLRLSDWIALSLM